MWRLLRSPGVEFRLLGHLEVVDEGGRELPVRAGQQRALLALLLLRANELVPSERLVEELWGESPPRTAQSMLHNQVSALRRALGRGGRLDTRGGGYRLNVGDGERDVDRFEQLVARGQARLDDDPQGAAEALREALALWRGPPLADLVYEPFAQPEIARLEERRQVAFEERVDAELALGRHADLVAELETAVSEHPLRERLHGRLMLALYRCGRQAEALKAYRRARGTLVGEIGVEPGAELRALQAAILAQDPALDQPAGDAELPPALEGGSPLLAGRGKQLAELRERLADARAGQGAVVLVSGPPGIGKTRLAAELARRALRERMTVGYASADVPVDEALTAVRRAAAAERPSLLVVDDGDDASPPLLDEVSELAKDAARRPLLMLVLHGAPEPPPALAAATRLRLGPLDDQAVAEIARLYLPLETDLIPVRALAAESAGVPLAIHRAAREWAGAQAAERLVATAGQAALGRSDLRAAEATVAGDVIDLQAVRERGRLYLVDEPELGDRAPADAVCPFLGLATFDAAHADYFFGRERLVAELVARLVGAPLLAVVGPSGSGKSSALRAGLLPSLASGVLPGSERWRQAVMRPGEHPLEELARAMVRVAPEAAGGVPALLATLAPGERQVLAVDQFEEAFTACRDEQERAAFLAALVDLARDRDQRVLVLIALRADFYGRCAAHAELADLVSADQVLVGPMRRDELRRVIELPARQVGLRVEPALTDALVADVLDEPGGLPLLSAALLELWRERDGRVMRRAAYDRIGGVRGAVGRLAEETYRRLSEPERHAARRILMRLADAGEQETAFVRRRVPREELDLERDAHAAAALATLTDSRLVTADERTLEVAHEALLREWPRLRDWLDEDTQGRRLHHHLRAAAKEWEMRGRDPGELFRGARLASALDWAADHDAELNDVERAFLDDGRAASERAHRRLRMALATVASLLVLAVIAGMVALNERGNARDEAVAAAAQRLGAQALLEDDLDRSLLLARQGMALDDSLQTRGNLLAALLESPAAIGVLRGDGDRLVALDLSPDERTLAFIDNDGTLSFVDPRTRRPAGSPATVPGHAGIIIDAAVRLDHLRFSPDGSRLAVGGGEPVVLDARTHRVLAPLRFKHDGFIYAVRFSPDGRTLFAAIAIPPNGTTIQRFDARTGEPVGRGRHVSRDLVTLMLTRDGRRLVTTRFGEDTVIRDARTLLPLHRWPVRAEQAALSPDDRTMLVGGRDGSVRFLDLVTGEITPASGRHDGGVERAAFSPDGNQAITAGEDGRMIVWDVERASAGETLEGHAGQITGLAITRDGPTLYTSGLDSKVLVWDLAGARRLGRPFNVGADNPEGPRYALSPDGRVLAVGQRDGTVTLTDAHTLRALSQFRVVPTGPVRGMGYVPGGRLLVVGGDNGFLSLVDPRRGRIVKRVDGLRDTVFTPSFSADGRLMATASGFDNVRLWALPSGRPVGHPLRGPPDIGDLSLSPDGRTLAVTRPPEGGVEIRDVPTLRRRTTLPGSESVWDIARFTPDGRFLVGGSWKGWAQLWSAETWKPASRRFTGHAGRVEWQTTSPDGRTLATGGPDGTVRLWDLRTQQPLGAPLPGLPNRKVVPQFTPDGNYLFAIYGDGGRAYRWDVRPSSWARHACVVAGRTLTRSEWEEALPERDYDPAC
jgi:WD40 repeat protein/DNA-binding SARP family transcriptional activator